MGGPPDTPTSAGATAALRAPSPEPGGARDGPPSPRSLLAGGGSALGEEEMARAEAGCALGVLMLGLVRSAMYQVCACVCVCVEMCVGEIRFV